MFVTTLKGFVFLDEPNQETETIVKRIVTSTLFEGGDAGPTMETKHLLANHRDNIPQPMNSSVMEAIRFLSASVVVKCFELVKKEDIGTGEGGHPAWNIFAAPATTNRIALNDWIMKVRKTTFVTEANGTGTTKRIYTCSTCYSEGHPGGMCDFTKQHGWIPSALPHSPTLKSIINPTPASSTSRPTPTRRHTNSTSTRGRGTTTRGRGNHRA